MRVEISSSSSDDSDIDGDFNSVQTCFPKCNADASNVESKPTAAVVDDSELQPACIGTALGNFNDESSFLPSQPQGKFIQLATVYLPNDNMFNVYLPM